MDLTKEQAPSWRDRIPSGVRPYVEPAPLAALFLGISSAFPFTMIGATLSTMLRQNEVTRSTVTDETYREQFFGSVLLEMERAVGLRAVYLAARDRTARS